MGRLYVQVYSDENLTEAWHQVRTRGTESAGADGVSLAQFQRYLFLELRKLQMEPKNGAYRPLPVKLITIKKPGGGHRPIGILAIRDRVAQRAVLNVITPLFEAGFEPVSFGFRLGRSREMALEHVASLVNQGYQWTAHFDIERCFENIPLAKLRRLLARKLKDRRILRLINAWLEMDSVRSTGRGSISGGHLSGLTQGSPLSPLLANAYLDQFDKACRRKGIQVTRYADDVLLLGRSQHEVQADFKAALKMLKRLQLKVNPAKTRFLHVEEGIEFLGGTLVFQVSDGVGSWHPWFPDLGEEEGQEEKPLVLHAYETPAGAGERGLDGHPVRG